MTRILLVLALLLFSIACSSNELTEEEKDIFITAKLYEPFGFEYEPNKEKFIKTVLPDGPIKLAYEYRGTKNKTGQALSLDGIAISARSKANATVLFYSGLTAAKLRLKSQNVSLDEKKIPVSLGDPAAVYSLSHNSKPLGTLTTAVFGSTYYYYRVIGADLGDKVWEEAIGPRIQLVEAVLGK